MSSPASAGSGSNTGRGSAPWSQAPDRTDHVRTFGGGVGFRMGQDLRLGFNIDKERRTSVLTDREYEGLNTAPQSPTVRDGRPLQPSSPVDRTLSEMRFTLC